MGAAITVVAIVVVDTRGTVDAAAVVVVVNAGVNAVTAVTLLGCWIVADAIPAGKRTVDVLTTRIGSACHEG